MSVSSAGPSSKRAQAHARLAAPARGAVQGEALAVVQGGGLLCKGEAQAAGKRFFAWLLVACLPDRLLYACLLVCLFACFRLCLLASLLVCLFACLIVCLFACFACFACLRVCLLVACSPVRLFACLPVCLFAISLVCVYCKLHERVNRATSPPHSAHALCVLPGHGWAKTCG